MKSLSKQRGKFAFFPGDPGEDEYEFKDNWGIDIEPVPAIIDKWSTNIINVKVIPKPQNQDLPDEDNLSSRSFKSSRRPPSVSTSKRSVMKKTNFSGFNKDIDSRSKADNGSQIDRKENQNINVSQATISQQNKLLNQIPLDVPPPRVITEEEKALRDKKEKQLKVKELEMREQREKEEREKLRQKSKIDQQAELEKHVYTYDDNGNILFVKKPNVQRLQVVQVQKPEFQITSGEQKPDLPKPPKNIRIKSAKSDVKKSQQMSTHKLSTEKVVEAQLEVKAQQEVEENYKKIFGPRQDQTHEYGQGVDGIEVNPGIILNKENQRLIGPPIPRDRMTLAEYARISAEFDFGSDRMKKYESQQKLLSPKQFANSELEIIEDNEQSSIMSKRGFSGERLLKKAGAETVYDKEITVQEYKMMLKAKRKDLKSATALKAYEKVIEKHNRLQSAQASEIRIRTNVQKNAIKERIFNYENYIGGVDMPPTSNLMSPSVQSSSSRPMSGLQSNRILQQRKDKEKPKKPVSVIDEYNKKLMERGADRDLATNDLPPVIKQHLVQNQNHQRPQTSKPIIQHNTSQLKGKFASLQVSQAIMTPTGDIDPILSAKNQNKKLPRERVISAKVKVDQEKLPPPPFGKTMGHGLLQKQ